MMDIGLYHYLILATLLFSIGLYGLLSARNAIRVLMCIELMLNAVNINLLAFNNFGSLHELSGQVFSIFILTVSAAEASVGLAILIAIYRSKASVDMEQFNVLKS
jgi:NAD(P)H-quinone oxidoreductase subunit 4L